MPMNSPPDTTTTPAVKEMHETLKALNKLIAAEIRQAEKNELRMVSLTRVGIALAALQTLIAALSIAALFA